MAALLLIFSIGLSWNRVATIFDTALPIENSAQPLLILASTVCITSFGLAFSIAAWPIGILIVVVGLLLARFVQGLNIRIAVPLSVALLLAYIRLVYPLA
ncbi:hypothetical protein HGP17_09970 [Rhizobium sp. P38BS-XIX]|uniref:hypothetical protein n=1 Tax=Rhizobium sp. P38BS-XIX TaxID=2726740 RepID=UPI00145653AC|nr:hypothetical protein [Rhizobium sp. P38BS-XIX]NLR97161.1 hypothetical protein [Rhizobium sp. P38BS-XIX]